MSERKKLPRFTTPAGVFRYPKLTEPDYGTSEHPKPDGEYSVQLLFRADSPEAQQLLQQLTPHYEAAMEEAKKAFDNLPVGTRKKLKEVTKNPLFLTIYDRETEEETGEIAFKFAMKASGEYRKGPKAGQKWSRAPLIFDARGRRIQNPPAIWGGTVGKVAFEAAPYFIPGTGAAGLSLKLIGVQILDLVSGGERSAESLGFTPEEGYEYSPEDAVNSSHEEDEDDGSGDF